MAEEEKRRIELGGKKDKVNFAVNMERAILGKMKEAALAAKKLIPKRGQKVRVNEEYWKQLTQIEKGPTLDEDA